MPLAEGPRLPGGGIRAAIGSEDIRRAELARVGVREAEASRPSLSASLAGTEPPYRNSAPASGSHPLLVAEWSLNVGDGLQPGDEGVGGRRAEALVLNEVQDL